MSSDDKVVKVMKGLSQALEARGWCLVEGAPGAGKTRAVQGALQQLGWEAVWKGPGELVSEEAQEAFHGEPREVLVFDGLVDEWGPGPVGELPDQGWTYLYAAMTVAMARAHRGLLTILSASCHEGGEEHINLEEVPGCVCVSLR